MTTQDEFFESLIEYIDAAIDVYEDGNYSEYNAKRKKRCKEDLKESLSKFATELFHGH